jgi:polyphosphate kinase
VTALLTTEPDVNPEHSTTTDRHSPDLALDAPDVFFDRELSWLAFARRVLALAEDGDLPLLERLKFAGIMGVLHDEFFMKRIAGLKRLVRKGSTRRALAGQLPEEQLAACRQELLFQTEHLDRLILDEILPALAREGTQISHHGDLDEDLHASLRDYFRLSVLPILTPLAVDAEHPFPFISNEALNLGIWVPVRRTGQERFVRIKIPDNRPRWIARPDGLGFVPLEEVIASNLDLVFPDTPPREAFVFRVTRSAKGSAGEETENFTDDALREPGSIVRLVSNELKARRFAGVVRLQVDTHMPEDSIAWLCRQLDVGPDDVDRSATFLRVSDLLRFEDDGREHLMLPEHSPVTHPRLRELTPDDPTAIFDEIARGDILLHHPYDSFDSSVLHFLQSASVDPDVLAIKLTIYRTSKDSPIVQALAEAARRGKQVAVLVEITARFDEAPNIAWGRFLENQGVHVSYGVEKLKTHVKLALVVREERGRLRRYAHVGTGNYHTGTARIYEDLGVLTCHPEICEDTAKVFNELTGASEHASYQRMLVAPRTMRRSFTELIRREAEHAKAGAECGIRAKMNQLQDRAIIGELYRASQAGVPIELNVRGLCCLRPSVPGLSDNIRVFSVLGRFLEHSRIYRFANAGEPEHFIGSADWMKRNLDRRVETIMPVLDEEVGLCLDLILDMYAEDNSSAWDCQPDGIYTRRTPAEGEEPRAAQDVFIESAGEPDVGDEKQPAEATDSDNLLVAADLV